MSDSGGAAAGGTTSGTGGGEAVGGTSGGGTTAAPGGTSATGGDATAGDATAGNAAGGTTTATGGASTTGGRASGGTTAAGGASTTGGRASGGTTAAGGASDTGGSSTTGGSSAAGGATGGSTNVGGASAECTPPATYENFFVTLSGHTQEEVDSKVSAAWSSLFNPSSSGTLYFDGPGSDESYVKDIYNNDVRTEGMSYGMITAVQLDHQTEFDRLWSWVRNHMAQGCSGDKCTGEIAWSCSTSGSKNSGGGAPDGEEYFATALIFAQNRWGDTGKFKYGTEAKWVLDVIRTKYFHTNPHLVKFVASSNNTDASYVLPAFYQVWACFDTANAEFWNTAVKDGREFFHVAGDSNGVFPDQSSWTGGTVKGATVDWIRCVVNIMMDHNFFNADPWQTETYAPKFAAHEKNAGGAQGFCSSTLAMGLPAADGKAFADKLWSANIPSRDYWGGTLYMLSLLHLSGNFKLYY
ncbi:MAG: hypothetical protein JW940_16805 [Polyangiaceae bacterium]|nr:hypothetical protein [Polyangiaceae bacterium]